jgi:hypothetical protein
MANASAMLTALGDPTRVVLEHSGLDAYGDATSAMQTTFEDEGAWTATLAAYAARVAR